MHDIIPESDGAILFHGCATTVALVSATPVGVFAIVWMTAPCRMIE